MHFGEAAVVVKKTAITNYDRVGWRERRRKIGEKSIKQKSIAKFFFVADFGDFLDGQSLPIVNLQMSTDISSRRAGSGTAVTRDSHETIIFSLFFSSPNLWRFA